MGFLMARGYKPAYVPWLNLIIRAGDVHPNPGPKCASCGITIRSGTIPLACGLCQKAYHKQCARVTRATADKLTSGRSDMKLWRCGQPCGAPLDLRQAQQEDDEPNLAENNTEEWKGSKCAKCNGPMRKATIMPRCRTCKRWVHQKEVCSGETRAAWAMIVLDQWTCQPCRIAQRPTAAIENKPTLKVEAEQIRGLKEKKCLRICQWNADSIIPKRYELERWARQEKLDVIMIQESKLNSQNKFDGINGFSTVRHDRTCLRNSSERRGGGLLTLIKDDIFYKKLSASKNNIIEELTVEVWLDNEESIKLTNIYKPPLRNTHNENRQEEEITEMLRESKHHLICGDINMHSPTWDSKANDNEEAIQLELWCAEKEYQILNSPLEHTHLSRITGTFGSPDVSLASMDIAHLIRWEVKRALSSDHFPIVIQFNKAHNRKRQTRHFSWAWKRADWKQYTAALETKILPEGLTMAEKVKWFTAQVLGATTIAVPVKKSSDQNRPFWSPALKELELQRQLAIQNGNTEETNRINQEWRKKTVELQRKCWREHVAKLREGDDQRKLWRTIRKMNGMGEAKAKNEMLNFKGKARVTDQQKAAAFVEHYASVNKLQLSKEEKMVRNNNARKLEQRHAYEVSREEDQPLTMNEFEVAIAQMDDNKKGGNDRIEPPMVSHLTQNMKEILLSIYNESWFTGVVPGSWKQAVIIPIPKTGKPADNVESYRPISLTSVLAKVMERIIANRVGYWLECNKTIQNWQLGFQRLKSTEQQCTRLTQDIYDGFQAKPNRKTVAALLDCSKAYDRVWRERLIKKMNDIQMPLRMTMWIKCFLEDRKAKVRLGESESKWRKMSQGLPQGAVLSPVLFLIYTSDLLKDNTEDVQISGYADDVAVWATDRSIEVASRKVQATINQVEEWARINKVELNADKSEGIVCSSYNCDWGASPRVTVGGKQLRFSNQCRFLGVIVDNGLTFNKHVQMVTTKMRERTKVLAALTGREWGCELATLKNIYNATVESVMLYALPSWMPWISPSNCDLLEREQKRAAKIITGLTATCPDEAVWREADIIPARVRGRMLAVRSYEKTLRLPAEHPLRVTASKHVPNRFKRTKGWREEARAELLRLTDGEVEREPFTATRPKPWAQMGALNLHSNLVGGSNKSSKKDILLADIYETMRLRGQNAGASIYTDGSVGGNNRNGGSAIVVMEGDNVVDTVMEATGVLCASYDAELNAIGMAARWIAEHKPTQAIIYTDSRASVESIRNLARYDEPLLSNTRKELARATTDNEVTLQWIPGHLGVLGNEAADRAADNATRGEQAPRATWTAIKSVLRRDMKMPEVNDPRRRKVYQTKVKATENADRKAQVLLAQLRSGHCPATAFYRRRFLKEEAVCELCDEAEETPDHFWECSASLNTRLQMIQSNDCEEALRERGGEVLTFLRHVRPGWVARAET